MNLNDIFSFFLFIKNRYQRKKKNLPISEFEQNLDFLIVFSGFVENSSVQKGKKSAEFEQNLDFVILLLSSALWRIHR